MTVNEKLARLRLLMERESVDTYIITKNDPHQSEYTPDYWNQVEYISGFTGSAGVAVVTMSQAGLWVDGRYFIQAEMEISGSEFKMYKDAEPGVRGFEELSSDETPSGGVIGFNGYVLSMSQVKKIEKLIKLKNIAVKTDLDLIGEIWADDRPALSKAPVFIHELKFCGISRKEKLSQLREKMKKRLADFYVISSTDDIAWLFNLRGNDMPYKSFFESFAVIDYEKAALFIDKDKTFNIRKELEQDKVALYDIGEIKDYLIEYNKQPGKIVLLNPDKTGYALYRMLNNCEISECEHDITASMKAIKNKVEFENLEKVNIRDGTAMVKFIIWLKENAGKGIDEVDAANKALELRKTGENFVENSFETIAAYMSNAAMMHYSPVKTRCAEIKPEGVLLLDSGGNYYDGSTDITRTIVLGKISDKLIRDFTLVLKSHISMAEAVFVYGATGTNLDTFARIPMWKECMDYKSGTGHGLGFFLNVHEGPQSLTPRSNSVVFEEDMITTNEPGIYREGEYGIRTENTMRVVNHRENEFGKFLKFETISYCPIDLEGIKADILTSEERNWLNSYHKTVYEKLSPYLLSGERKWLSEATREI